MPLKIAFIVDVFPSLSTTFIINQITGLLDKGHDVKIFSQYRSKEEKVHSDIQSYHLLNRVRYFDIPENKIFRLLKAFLLLILTFPKAPIKTLRALNFIKYGNFPGTLTFSYLYAFALFSKENFDVIHCQFGTVGNIGASLKQIGIKGMLVASFRGYDIRLGLRKEGFIYKILFKSADCIMPNSHYAYEQLINFGANPSKMTIHPSGIHIHRFPFKWNTDRPEDPSSLALLTVARLVEVKGIEYGIRAVYDLKKRNPKYSFTYRIIGGGHLEQKLKKLVRDLRLNDVIQILGPMDQEEVIKNLKQAHIFLLPSLEETLAGVTMEAQAVGLPVIATAVGALSEVVIDGKSGFLVPPKNVNALTEKLDYLIKHPEIWAEMGDAGRRHIEENYDINKLNNRLENTYLKLTSLNYS